MQTQPSPKPFSLKDVPSKRFTELKNLVNTSNGRVIIIMHPYYAEQTSGYNQKYYEKYLRVIEGIIKQTRIPIIILEGRPGIIKKRLGENISSKKNVFCFPSYDDHENIVEDAYKQDLITRSDSKKLIEILTKAGVREVQLGGSFFGRKHSPEVFAHERKWLPPRLSPSPETLSILCAGSCYKNLIKSGLFERVSLIQNACFDKKPTRNPRVAQKREIIAWKRKMLARRKKIPQRSTKRG